MSLRPPCCSVQASVAHRLLMARLSATRLTAPTAAHLGRSSSLCDRMIHLLPVILQEQLAHIGGQLRIAGVYPCATRLTSLSLSATYPIGWTANHLGMVISDVYMAMQHLQQQTFRSLKYFTWIIYQSNGARRTRRRHGVLPLCAKDGWFIKPLVSTRSQECVNCRLVGTR